MGTRVADVMTRDVETVRLEDDVHALEKLMLKKKVHGVPVVDDAGKLVGVVSQTDLLAWHFHTGVDGASYYGDPGLLIPGIDPRTLKVDDIRTAKVEEVMSPLVYCIGPDRPLAEAAAMMIRKWIHRLVVVDDEHHVLGVISAIDLLHSFPGAKEALHDVANSGESEDSA
jgi:CBS-domain-containing membrane protein